MEPGIQRITFGKHCGKTFEEVRCQEKGYCQWALRQEQPSGALKEFVQYLKSEPEVSTPRKRRMHDEPSSSAKRQRTGNLAADVAIIEGKDAKRLHWHLTRRLTSAMSRRQRPCQEDGHVKKTAKVDFGHVKKTATVDFGHIKKTALAISWACST